MSKNIIHILSGGLDSTTLLYWLLARNRKIQAIISFNYGQKHVIELQKAKETVELITKMLFLDIPHHVVDISSIGSLLTNSALTSDKAVPIGHYEDESMKQTVVPNRNMAFLSIAAMKAVNDNCDLSIGIHAGDHAIYPDCREQFTQAFEKAVRVGNWGADDFNIIAPFLNMSKSDIVAAGIQAAGVLKIDYRDIFSRTWTCYDPQYDSSSELSKSTKFACGKCGSCTERLEAFHENNTTDPISYMESK